MANKKKSSRAKQKADVAREIEEELSFPSFNPNPIKRQIKIKQFPWTEKQKEFFKVALDFNTKIVFVDGPAGTSKTLLSTYCGLQLLNMKAISDITINEDTTYSEFWAYDISSGAIDEEDILFFVVDDIDTNNNILAKAAPKGQLKAIPKLL